MKLNRRTLNGLRGIDQNSLFAQYGTEWGGLNPDVRAQVLANWPNVYGGQFGRMVDPIPGIGQVIRPMFAHDNDGFPTYQLTLPNGEPRIVDGNGNEISYDSNVYHYNFGLSNDTGDYEFRGATLQPGYAANYSPMTSRGFVQVQRNPYNGSWLSLGAAGGYRDPRLIEWDSRYGLITPESNVLYDHDSFWESWGPFILATLAIGGVAAGGVAAGAGGEAAATSGAAAATETAAATAATTETAATVGSTEAFTAGEEALREIGMAQSLGATITQGEAAGWVSALSNAGLAVPADIASIASGAAQGGTGTSYQSPPSPPSGGTTPQPVSTTPSAGSVLNTAGKVISNPLVKTAAGLIAAGAASGATGNNPAPNAGYSYASPNMTVDYTKTQAQTAGKVSASGQPFNWLWLLAAGAGVYFVKQKMLKKGSHAIR